MAARSATLRSGPSLERSATSSSTVFVPMSMVATRIAEGDPLLAAGEVLEIEHLLDIRLENQLDAPVLLHLVSGLLLGCACDGVGCPVTCGRPMRGSQSPAGGNA